MLSASAALLNSRRTPWKGSWFEIQARIGILSLCLLVALKTIILSLSCEYFFDNIEMWQYSNCSSRCSVHRSCYYSSYVCMRTFHSTAAHNTFYLSYKCVDFLRCEIPREVEVQGIQPLAMCPESKRAGK
jgi:hypothetical protein